MGNPKVDIGSTVLLAYMDVTAAASRALFGVEGERLYQTLSLPTLEGASPACVHSPQTKMTRFLPPMDPVQVINCRYEQKNKPEFTLLIINTHLQSESSHYVAKAIVDLCSFRHVRKLVILTAQRMDVEQRSKLFENIFNGMASMTQRARLPANTVITDAFLSNLIQLCSVEGQPFSVITAPAHRASPGQASTEDGSLQLIRLFQNTITNSCGLMFSDKLSSSLVYRDRSNDTHSTLMYA